MVVGALSCYHDKGQGAVHKYRVEMDVELLAMLVEFWQYVVGRA